MEIVKLPVGIAAPADADCIRIQELPGGAFALEGNLLAPADAEDIAESVSLIASDPYPTYDAAESAGLAWAHGCKVAVLHVARSDGTTPLPDPAE
ncbi:hypothetical protein [Sphingomonas sp.]|uniref:hypothetical protein n=1 Tax=Sphingomonas sp. TaxID=28214 RepID=UPI003B3A040B